MINPVGIIGIGPGLYGAPSELRRIPLPRTPENKINIARLEDAPRFLEIVGCPWLQQRIEDL